MKKKGFSLAAKLIVGFIVLAVLVCAITVGIGAFQYRHYIYKQYNDTAYQIAESFQDYMTEEELTEYVKLAKDVMAGKAGEEEIAKVTGSERYQYLNEQLNHLRENMNANDIYMVYMDLDVMKQYESAGDDWKPSVYIFDSYIKPELTFPFGAMPGGPNADFVKEAIRILETGKRSDNYFISESEFGYNTSAILPVVDDSGETIAVIGVEIPMKTLSTAIREYLLHSIIGILSAIAVCMAVYAFYLFRSVVAPINLIAAEAGRFVEDENKISGKLSSVRTKDEIQSLSEALLKMEIDINTYIENLTIVTREKERIGAELDVATQIQADMLPNIFPAFPDRDDFEIYATMNPAKEVGGDFYDFFLVDDDHLALVIADVSGKGIPAALFMVIAKTLIKNQLQTQTPPARALEIVNDQLCENNEAMLFVTAWVSVLELSTGKVTAVNAGHEFPMILRRQSGYELMEDQHGFVMGALEGARYQEYEFCLEKGDGIYLYTDGAPDATAASQDQFGRERLLASLNRDKDASPEELLKSVKSDIDEFVGEAEQFDDITMLGIVYNGGQQ